MDTEYEIPFGEQLLHPDFLDAGGSTTLLYIHGGGLIYGSKRDLPAPYLAMLQKARINLARIEYPFAPETRLDAILEAVHLQVRFLASRLPAGKRYLFGRSSGAFLALQEQCRLIREGAADCVQGVVSFYGYSRLDLPEFSHPNSYWSGITAPTAAVFSALTKRGFVTECPLENGFGVYAYARSHGIWSSLLCDSPADYSLDAALLAQVPACFLTASAGDPDVPFGQSKALARLIPNSVFHPVYCMEHDFDRDLSKPEGREVYAKLIAWLAEA